MSDREYDGLLQDEDEAVLICGCKLWRIGLDREGWNGDEVAFKYCPTHDAVSPWSKASASATRIMAETLLDPRDALEPHSVLDLTDEGSGL